MNIEDTLKNLLLASVGAVAWTVEKGGELVAELVKKGEITVEQGKALNEELKRKAAEKNGDQMLAAVDRLSKEERDALKERLAELDKDEEQSK